MSSSDSSMVKKPRASRPKVKTGCVTCKARRVKCDETKPRCLNCSKFGRSCGGYHSREESPPPKAPGLLLPRKLLSKALQSSSAPSRSPVPVSFSRSLVATHVDLSLLPAGIVFQDEREYHYFCHFRDQTAIELSAGFDPSLWNVVVLNACDNPAIRQLVIATAAMGLAIDASQTNGPYLEQSVHKHYALQQYGEAVKAVREMEMGQDSMRAAVVSALLIFCLESIQGDFKQAATCVQSAMEMTVKRISSDPQSFYFPRVDSLGSEGSEGASRCSAIHHDLLTAFMRLHQNCTTLSPCINRIFDILFLNDHLEIPRGFATTAEARVYLEDIKWRINAADETERMELKNISNSERSKHEASPITREKYAHMGREIEQWQGAFSPILQFALSPTGDAVFLAAVTLHIQALFVGLLTTSTFSASGAIQNKKPSIRSGSNNQIQEAEAWSSTVRNILSLSRRLVSHSKFLKRFVFDVGIIPCLVIIWKKYPERRLKLEAIDVLKSMAPRREGYWDSVAAAEEGERFMEEYKDSNSCLEMIDPNLLGGV